MSYMTSMTSYFPYSNYDVRQRLYIAEVNFLRKMQNDLNSGSSLGDGNGDSI